MSLDVYLTNPSCSKCGHSPDGYNDNITHNLTGMAGAAGIYEALWHPDRLDITSAKQLIPLLEEGLRWLRKFPTEAASYDAENGWGSSLDFIPFVERYVRACRENPEATVSTCT